jgi:hypothetical protein
MPFAAGDHSDNTAGDFDDPVRKIEMPVSVMCQNDDSQVKYFLEDWNDLRLNACAMIFAPDLLKVDGT